MLGLENVRFHGLETDQCDFAESRCTGEAEGKVFSLHVFMRNITCNITHLISGCLSLYKEMVLRTSCPGNRVPASRKLVRVARFSVTRKKCEVIASRKIFATFYSTMNPKMAKRIFTRKTFSSEMAPKMHT